MSGLFKQYKTNATAETEGVRIEFPEAVNDDGSVPAFILSRMGRSNKQYAKALEAATRPVRRQLELKTIKEEKSDEILLDVFVNNVLRGWENVYDENGQLMAFSPIAAKHLLTALPDFYERLRIEASEMANFREAAREEEAKN